MSKMAKTTVITRKSSVKIELTKKGTPVSDCTLSPFPACKDDEVTLRQFLYRRGGVKLNMKNAISMWKEHKKSVRKGRKLTKKIDQKKVTKMTKSD